MSKIQKKVISSEQLRTTEEYQTFIEECKAIIVERTFIAQTEILKGKWELGKRISEEELNFQRAGYGEKIIETIAQDLGISNTHLWKCIQFYKKFQIENFDDVVSQLPGGKGKLSWYQVCQNVLPEKTEKEKEEKQEEKKECSHSKLQCVDCGLIFTIEDLMKQDKNL